MLLPTTGSTIALTQALPVSATYRLTIAYGKYLRFPHALASVVLSQIVVFLLLLNIFFIASVF